MSGLRLGRQRTDTGHRGTGGHFGTCALVRTQATAALRSSRSRQLSQVASHTPAARGFAPRPRPRAIFLLPLGLLPVAFAAGYLLGHETSTTSRPEKPRTPPVSAATGRPTDPGNGQDRALAEKSLREYFATDSIEQRLRFVRKPADVRSAMERYYKTLTASTAEEVEIRHVYDIPTHEGVPLPYSVFGVRFKDDKSEEGYFMVKTPDGYKVDWEASVPAGMGLMQFIVDMPPGPVKFRVSCEISNSYNYEFRNAKPTHYSFSLLGTDGKRIQGYLPRDHADARRLFELASEPPHCVILELKHEGPDGRATRSSGEDVLITRMVSPSWIEW